MKLSDIKTREEAIAWAKEQKQTQYLSLIKRIPEEVVVASGTAKLRPQKADAKVNTGHWYNQIKDLAGEYFDNAGDMLCPVPGTYQGGFKVGRLLIPNIDF